MASLISFDSRSRIFVTLPPTFTFDGVVFAGDSPATEGLSLLWMAYHARRGDAAAIELLNLAAMSILAADGTSYWPVSK